MDFSIQTQVRFVLGFTVAFHTALLEERANVGIKIDSACRRAQEEKDEQRLHGWRPRSVRAETR